MRESIYKKACSETYLLSPIISNSTTIEYTCELNTCVFVYAASMTTVCVSENERAQAFPCKFNADAKQQQHIAMVSGVPILSGCRSSQMSDVMFRIVEHTSYFMSIIYSLSLKPTDYIDYAAVIVCIVLLSEEYQSQKISHFENRSPVRWCGRKRETNKKKNSRNLFMQI